VSWVELNVPWHSYGTELQEQYNTEYAAHLAWCRSEIARLFGTDGDHLTIEDVDAAETIAPALKERERFEDPEWLQAIESAFTDPRVVQLARRRHRTVHERQWMSTSSEVRAWNTRATELLDQLKMRSFAQHPMNRAGVLIEMREEDGTLTRALIGDINRAAGECGCCSAAGDQTVIVRAFDLRTLPEIAALYPTESK
jgi:hypothetical protein